MHSSEKIARFYQDHDKAQVARLDSARWHKILDDTTAWQSEVHFTYNKFVDLPTSRAFVPTVRMSSSQQVKCENMKTHAAVTGASQDMHDIKTNGTMGTRARVLIAQVLDGVTEFATKASELWNQVQLPAFAQAGLLSLLSSRPYRAVFHQQVLEQWLDYFRLPLCHPSSGHECNNEKGGLQTDTKTQQSKDESTPTAAPNVIDIR